MPIVNTRIQLRRSFTSGRVPEISSLLYGEAEYNVPDAVMYFRTSSALKSFISLEQQVLIFAGLNSPVFTGAPRGPTAAPGTNTTQLANTAFVRGAIADLVASSPAALDTLNELAAALGNDPNFAATMATALGNRLRVDAAQGLTSGQQSQGRSNLGLGTAATQDTSAFATAAQGVLATAALPSASYTASDVLTKVKSLDGSGSGLDADVVRSTTPTTKGLEILSAADAAAVRTAAGLGTAATEASGAFATAVQGGKADTAVQPGSAALTGSPTAPTATAGTNNTQISTTQFVTSAVATAINTLLDSPPGALDTLNELAAALGDDPNFATTTATALGNRLRVDANQSLTAPQQAQGRTNLALGSAALADASAFAAEFDVIDGGLID